MAQNISFDARAVARALRACATGASLVALLALVRAPDAAAAIAVSKSIDNTVEAYPSTIVPGDVTAFRITLTNDNTAAAVSNVAFADNMAAANIVVAGAGVVANTCGGSVTAVVDASSFDLAGGTIRRRPAAVRSAAATSSSRSRRPPAAPRRPTRFRPAPSPATTARRRPTARPPRRASRC
ncbi:MAG: hypothetical protein AB7I32_14050 [Gammaproteobacteria bacterium]